MNGQITASALRVRTIAHAAFWVTLSFVAYAYLNRTSNQTVCNAEDAVGR